ncbi:MAG: putative porin [Parafilimonas sp.]
MKATTVNFFAIIFFSVIAASVSAQEKELPGNLNKPPVAYDNLGRPIKRDTTNQTLQHRNPLEDSITIVYHFFDSTRIHTIDSSISDFYTRFPIPYYYVDIGNLGNAAHSILFNPIMQPGFDAGFHAYDVYRLKIPDTRFYQTTRPYTETAYLLGSRGEQMIDLFHTQNRKSNFNFTFDFRVINSPGAFKNQNTNHNNLRINTAFQSNNKRYTNYFIFINNKIESSENGGVQRDAKLDSLSLNNPFEAETRLGTSTFNYRNIFSSQVNTGTAYKESVFLMEHSYDFGQKDSLVKDTITYKLFYPRFRFQHTIQYSKNQYLFEDFFPVYNDYYNYLKYILVKDTVLFKDEWQSLINEFSIISFPEKNNLNQFLKAGAGYEIIKGSFSYYTKDFHNLYINGEYRNRTRNQLWDVAVNGKLYLTGDHTGDYAAYISLKRSLKKNIGSLELGFQNVNRTPSFISANSISSFPVLPRGDFKKENMARFFTNVDVPPLNLQLMGEYYLITNYVYFDGLYSTKQESTLFNIIHAAAQKKFTVAKHLNLYTELHLQQITANAPVHLPFIFTRNRFAYEGNFFKNLFLSTGIEIKYYTPYKADDYSPLNGQFFVQDTETISIRPNVNLFLNIRIKSFKGFIRLENINSVNPADGFAFTHYDFVAPHYASRALWVRLGIWWNFVN